MRAARGGQRGPGARAKGRAEGKPPCSRPGRVFMAQRVVQLCVAGNQGRANRGDARKIRGRSTAARLQGVAQSGPARLPPPGGHRPGVATLTRLCCYGGAGRREAPAGARGRPRPAACALREHARRLPRPAGRARRRECCITGCSHQRRAAPGLRTVDQRPPPSGRRA